MISDKNNSKDWFTRFLMLLVGGFGAALITFMNFNGDLVAVKTKVEAHDTSLTEIKNKIDRIYEFVLRAEGRKEAEEKN